MILVTGAGGFVGHKIMEMCRDTVAGPSLRGAAKDRIRQIVEEIGPDTIIHTAAISDISACAADPEASYHANVMIPVFLAEAVRDRNIKLICFSSDQVYTAAEGDGPYSEDMAKPGNVYAEHKLEMEKRVLDIAPDSVMLRAEWMYDYDPGRSNYFMNILRAHDAVRFSSMNYRGVTYLREVAEAMESVIRLPGGVYNFGSETTRSMNEITKYFLEILHRDLPVNDCAPLHNLWMNCDKARRCGVVFSSVEEGLIKCLEDYRFRIEEQGFMKQYDEIWAADSRAVEEFFHDHPGDVTVIPLPDRKIGAMTLPQTRIIIKGAHAETLYQLFFQKFMKAGG